jgi:hypothetical protein
MKFIIISGHARAGKDTSANFMKEYFEENNKRVLIVHFADYLKFVCKQYMGWDGNKDDAGRTLLQYVGTDLIRSKNHRFLVDVVCGLSKMLDENFDYILVPDCRFPDEVEVPKLDYNFKTISIRIVRLEKGIEFDNGMTEEQKNHPSETALDNYKFDHYIYNGSDLIALKESVRKIANKI